MGSLSFHANYDTLEVTDLGSASHGTVNRSGGNVTYTPVIDYAGLDQFIYTVSDSLGAGDTSTASVTVRLGEATSVFNYIPAPVNNAVSLRGYGIFGNTYDVQESGDLSNWTTLGSVTAEGNGMIIFTDHNANTSPRYYRFAVQ